VSDTRFPFGDGWNVRDNWGLSFVWRDVRLPIVCGSRELMAQQLRDLARCATEAAEALEPTSPLPARVRSMDEPGEETNE
jgi:hypothetical protein